MTTRKKPTHHTVRSHSRSHKIPRKKDSPVPMITGKRLMVKQIVLFLIGIILGLAFLFLFALYQFDSKYKMLIYPGISANNIKLGGMTREQVVTVFDEKSDIFTHSSLTLFYEDTTSVATISGEALDISYDGSFTADQALSVGRSGNFLNDIYFKIQALSMQLMKKDTSLVTLPILITYDSKPIDEMITNFATQINTPAIEPLFEFDTNTKRVTAFKLGKNGKQIDEAKTKSFIDEALLENKGNPVTLPVVVSIVEPKTKSDRVDTLGIAELIGHGESYYYGSIPGRIHNLILASSRTSGVLVPPGETYSFNETVGDISAATGYESAYIIKNGRTVLGDGGGVCQVSTTIFRAALDAGLEIVERKPHSYRVAYYEQGGYKPGMDATVYSPSTDLKIKNTTLNTILIQATVYESEHKLEFDIYGTDDGRSVTISDTRVWDQIPPPPPLYQDDPTLAPGVVKQVDWAASGAKAAFDYLVIKNGETLQQTTFYSNFQPWQAVFLKGPSI